jgi:hypothetical protein
VAATRGIARSPNFGRHILFAAPMPSKPHYQAFFWVLIDLIVDLLGLIMKPFDNQTES